MNLSKLIIELENVNKLSREFSLKSYVRGVALNFEGEAYEKETFDRDSTSLIFNILKVKLITKILKIENNQKNSSEYRENIENYFSSIKRILVVNYIPYKKKSTDDFDNYLLMKILLGEEFDYWKNEFTYKQKVFFKNKSNNIEYLIGGILTICDYSDKLNFTDFTFEIIKSSMTVLKESSSMNIEYYDMLNQELKNRT